MEGTINLRGNKKENIMSIPQKREIERRIEPENIPQTEYIEHEKQKKIELEEKNIEENIDFESNSNEQILSDITIEYINDFRKSIEKENEKVISPIYVDEMASQLAKVYEKARRVIDWKEEHLVRRTAIERILKRRLISEVSGIYFLSNANPEKIAEPLVLELVRSGYFSNGTISKDKIPQVQKLLEKYIFILKNNPISKENIATSVKRKVEFYNWLLEIAACEIEETLEPPYKQLALLKYMANSLDEKIKTIPENKLSELDRKIQIQIAVQRNLLDLDDAFISYYILKIRYPKLFDAGDIDLEKYSFEILNIWDTVEEDLSKKEGAEFYKVAEKYDSIYLIVSDVLNILANEVGEIKSKIEDKSTLSSLIKQVYEKRRSTLKKRLFRSAIYSTLSIFLAGSVSLFIVEVPLAKLVYGEFSPFAMFVDILLPTAFMFVLVMMIKPPSKSNFEKLKTEILKSVYFDNQPDVYELQLVKKKRVIMNAIFVILYLAIGFASLYFVFWIFDLANVPWTSLYIDTLNIAVVVSAAVIIKQKSKEITFEESGNVWNFIVEMLSLPLAKIGSWLSNKWKEYNFVSVFFTTLVDTPFATFIATIEDWRSFIKEKRSEIH